LGFELLIHDTLLQSRNTDKAAVFCGLLSREQVRVGVVHWGGFGGFNSTQHIRHQQVAAPVF
jgi:hypothetical protein